MLISQPDFTEFVKDKYYDTFMECWFHKWFGNNILLPVTSAGDIRNKPNYLKNDLEVLRETKCSHRYFCMSEVMADDIEKRDDYFYDIHLLFVPLNGQNEENARNLFSSEVAIGFKQLKRHLSGYARIIGYELTRYGKILNFVEEG